MDTPLQNSIEVSSCPHIHTQNEASISNAASRQCVRFKICIISETGQHVDKCPDGPSFQRMSPFFLWICIPAQPPGRPAHDTAKYDSVFLAPSYFSLAPKSPLFSFLLSPSLFIWKIYFSLGLKQGSHLKFSFTKQKIILLEGNGSKEK